MIAIEPLRGPDATTPVNSIHPDYDAAAVEWSRARDALAGKDAVEAGGEKYVSRLDSQADEEFAAYVKREVTVVRAFAS